MRLFNCPDDGVEYFLKPKFDCLCDPNAKNWLTRNAKEAKRDLVRNIGKSDELFSEHVGKKVGGRVNIYPIKELLESSDKFKEKLSEKKVVLTLNEKVILKKVGENYVFELNPTDPYAGTPTGNNQRKNQTIPSKACLSPQSNFRNTSATQLSPADSSFEFSQSDPQCGNGETTKTCEPLVNQSDLAGKETSFQTLNSEISAPQKQKKRKNDSPLHNSTSTVPANSNNNLSIPQPWTKVTSICAPEQVHVTRIMPFIVTGPTNQILLALNFRISEIASIEVYAYFRKGYLRLLQNATVVTPTDLLFQFIDWYKQPAELDCEIKHTVHLVFVDSAKNCSAEFVVQENNGGGQDHESGGNGWGGQDHGSGGNGGDGQNNGRGRNGGMNGFHFGSIPFQNTNLLHLACSTSSMFLLNSVLQQQMVAYNERDSQGSTPLVICLKQHFFEGASLLIEKYKERLDTSGAMSAALCVGHQEMINKLLEIGAKDEEAPLCAVRNCFIPFHVRLYYFYFQQRFEEKELDEDEENGPLEQEKVNKFLSLLKAFHTPFFFKKK